MKQSSDSLSSNLLHSGLAVGESHVELLGALNDSLSLTSGEVVSHFTTVGSVVHEQQFNVFLVLDQKLSEATWQHVSGLAGLLLTDVWHLELTTELTADW